VYADNHTVHLKFLKRNGRHFRLRYVRGTIDTGRPPTSLMYAHAQAGGELWSIVNWLRCWTAVILCSSAAIYLSMFVHTRNEVNRPIRLSKIWPEQDRHTHTHRPRL